MLFSNVAPETVDAELPDMVELPLEGQELVDEARDDDDLLEGFELVELVDDAPEEELPDDVLELDIELDALEDPEEEDDDELEPDLLLYLLETDPDADFELFDDEDFWLEYARDLDLESVILITCAERDLGR